MPEFHGRDTHVRAVGAFRRMIRREDNRQYLRRTMELEIEQRLPEAIVLLLQKLEECEPQAAE
ncbi:hypothetical protein [Mesorhizobium sp. B2-6-4]|uniref:hypothetical protein n=1 Tax=Mesorhizobium sp. B2-6-4 TaxID=2589913 RepID=UPI001129A7DA|nr:hypothetical protein [Mesorhizobium sp. B2-6-4]TPJ49634.1 hypothetical protein FJ426_26375 [Mesorhizobium sp. B2-6-4]